MTDKPKEQLKYSVLEVKENQSDSVILKEGMNSTFSIQQIADDHNYLLKKKKGLS